jgi:hypothetical protein
MRLMIVVVVILLLSLSKGDFSGNEATFLPAHNDGKQRATRVKEKSRRQEHEKPKGKKKKKKKKKREKRREKRSKVPGRLRFAQRLG